MASFWNRVIKNPDMIFVAFVIGILLVMVIPLPPFVIDLLLTLGIATSLVLLLTAVYIQRALDFSTFPTVLLVITLFRLSLNVATTRSILLHGADGGGTAAAGDVIRAFGEFVIGGNYAVGIIVFSILIIINFVVITKGAGRIAEVAARFTLDAMPGKQMAIDADLNAGTINEEEARRRRSEVARESDFYGAMDGASKFVRGDAIAGILIVLVNIIGGIIIGTLQKGMDIATAASTFTLLTVGEGLVTQIPALMVSTAAGIIVTRTGNSVGIGTELARQISATPQVLYSAAAILGLIPLVSGLPLVPFGILASILGFSGYQLNQKEKLVSDTKKKEDEKSKLRPSDKIESFLSVDLLELEVGYGLISVVDAEQNGDLLDRISNIRKQFAQDYGIIVPPLRIRDNLELKPGDYQLLLKGVTIGSGSLMVGYFLAMDPGGAQGKVQGIPTKEPAFGLDAMWIHSKMKEQALELGYTVVDSSTVIATHLTELIREHSAELLGRQELQTLIDALKAQAPKVVEELIPNLLPVSSVLKICKQLLKESVSIRDLRSVFECLSEHALMTKDTMVLTESVRTALSRQITKKYIAPDNHLHLITLDKSIEETIAGGILQTDQGQQLSVEPDFVRALIASLREPVQELQQTTNHAIILCSPIIRPHLKSLLDRFLPQAIILSHNEISANIQIKAYQTVRLANAS